MRNIHLHKYPFKVAINGVDDIKDETNDTVYSSKKIAYFTYCLLVFAVFFITECIPVAVTSMLPYIFFPLLGIASSSDIAAKYFNNTNFLLFGGLLVASAIELTGLHKRVALNILSRIGTGLRSLMFGFMLVTWICSMFMSNTATTVRCYFFG